MSALLYMILTMSLAGSLLIGIMLLAEHFFGKRIPFRWQYYLWLIVIARLLIPGGMLTMQPQAAPVLQTQPAAVETLPPAAGDTAASGSMPALNGAPEAPAYDDWADLVEGRTDETWPRALLGTFTLVWMGGALLFFVQKLTAYRSYLRCLRAGLVPCEDAALLDRTAILAERLGIRRPVEVCVNSLASSPMLIGWRNPCVVLPESPKTRTEFECIVLHELIHWQRRDLAYKWAVQIAVCVHWFNPLVYVMNKRIARLCELSCDERVMQVLGHGEAAVYGTTLLNSMAGPGSCRAAAGTLELSENKRLLKERLERMEEHTKKKPHGLLAVILLSACLLLCAACTRVYVPLPAVPELPDIARFPAGARNSAVWAEGNADVSIRADGAWINLEPTDEGVVRADFDRSLYHVDISSEGDRTMVSCEGLAPVFKTPVTLYVPVQGVRSISAALTDSMQTGRAEAPVQSYSITSGMIETTVPASAESLTISAQDGLVRLLSDNDFVDAQIDLDLTDGLLLTAETLRSRVERWGSSARLACTNPQTDIDISAAHALVMLNAYTEYSVTDLIERWAAGSYDFEFDDAEAAEIAAALAEQGSEPAAVPTDTRDARGTSGGAVRSALSDVGAGLGELFADIGDGIGGLLKEVGAEVRSEILDEVSAAY